MKIMIVEDHRGVREMLRKLLGSRGAELAECTNGQEAVAAYRDFQPDWVLMDSTMKEEDGFSATRRLLDRFPTARVLMVSEDDIEQLRRAARAAGASAFVTKDYLLQTLTKDLEVPWNQLESQWLSPRLNANL